MTFDFIVVGSGPAGVSAAFPLVEAGLRVLMIDASTADELSYPAGEYLNLRRSDRLQWNWQVGNDFTALRLTDASSPKLRVPNLSKIFADFNEINRINTVNFSSIGSLASGGLSNVWGAGIAKFSSGELLSFPFSPVDLDIGYETVLNRIGVSGRSNDSLKDYFGIDHIASSPLELDHNCSIILNRFQRNKNSYFKNTISIGRARLALLAEDRDDRLGCNLSGLCLWGCHRRAIYSARYDLEKLSLYKNFVRINGFAVNHLSKLKNSWLVRGTDRFDQSARTYEANSIILAAGTIATTAIVLRSLKIENLSVRLLSNPTAAFVLVIPERIGCRVVRGLNTGQLVTSIDGIDNTGNIYCGLFPASYIPAREFLSRFPIGRAAAIRLWRMLMPATVVANSFLPGDLSNHSLSLLSSGEIQICGGASTSLEPTLRKLKDTLRKFFIGLGAFMPPGGFISGVPGSDIHYAGTLPMLDGGGLGTCLPNGELVGMPGVYVVDAANFSSLPAKPHTLTMMANAHRIAARLVRKK